MDDNIDSVLTKGIIFKKRSESQKDDKKKRTKAKKSEYIHGAHGSGSAKMKAEIRRRRAERHKK